MGKIIANNIKGMGWTARITLTVIFTLLASTFIYQGWYYPLQTQAAVSRQANWTSQYAATAFPNGAVNANYTIAAGSNRLLLVAIASTSTAAATKTISVTYGGQALTLAAGDSTVSRVNHTALYYLKEAGIAAATGTSLNVTVSGGTSYYNYVYAAVYAGVDQATPFTAAVNYNSSTADSAVGPLASFTVGANNQAVEVINLARSSSGTTARTITTWDADWGTANIAPAPIATSGYCATLYIRDRATVPAVATAETSQHTASSTNTYDSMTAMSINPVTDTTVPTVTINQASGQADPTATLPINFTVVFSEPVTGFATGDVTISGTAGGTKTATVTGSGTTYNVAVTGMTTSGTVIASIPAGVATDGTNNNSASTSTDNTVTWSTTGPTVTINQAAGQTDPGSSLINFTVVFSQSVSNFATGDVTLSGTAGATTAIVTGSGTTYNVAVTGMTASGTVVATIAAGVATNSLGNPNSASTSTDNTVTCDLTPPSGLDAYLPADEAADQPLAITLQSTTATDTSGPVQYYFEISTDNTFATGVQTGGWQSGTSYTPSARAYGTTYFWRVKARDGLANETAYSAPRSFSSLAACVRNDPTLSLLTGTGGVAATISSDHGTAVYNLLVKNNDYGSCPSTQLNLSASDTDNGNNFDPPAIGSPAVTLAPGAQTTVPVTITATTGVPTGQGTARVTSASDANHSAVISNDVTTTINVVACYQGVPYLIVGPDASFVAKAGSVNYTITMKNTNTGTGCSPVTFNLVKASETNSTDFNASSLSSPTLTLNAGQSGSVTLTVSSKATAIVGAVNVTTISANAAGYDSPPNIYATSTVGNPLLHNSESTLSSKWSAAGGWGMPGTKYGEFVCTTCHTDSASTTSNIQRIKQAITTPDTTKGLIPGNGQPVYFNRTEGGISQGVFGFDSGGVTPRTTSKKVCEVCHTYDATGANGVKAHPYATTATLGNHYGADGKDCIKCHTHNKGFGVGNMACNSCHGDSAATSISSDNRYVVAPPVNAAGVSGTPAGTGLVSSDPKVGAHQTHLRFFNGLSANGTIDQRCEACHGTLPTTGTHVDGTSSPNGKWSGLAIHNSTTPMTPNFTGGNCSNTYCHNPAGTNGSLNPANAGTGITPSWTDATYITDGTLKTEANCNRCHKSPGNIAGAITVTSGTSHAGFTINTDCAGCHGHNGGVGGSTGQQHMDGVKYGGGTACNGCHSYDVGDWATATHNFGGFNQGVGAHAKHIAYIKTRLGNIVLNPTADMSAGYGNGNSAIVCGVCHSNSPSNHSVGTPGDPRTIDFNLSTTYQFGPVSDTTLWYNGSFNTSSATKPKTCSNISCHYFTSPAWSTY